MKRIAMMSLVLVFAAFAGLCSAQENVTEEQIAALEATLFSNLEKMDTSDDAKFAEQLEAEAGNDGAAKCWFRCWRRPVRYYYPAYYYYTWYCPCYYVPFRIVTYTVPVVRQVVVTPAVVTPAVVTPAVVTPATVTPATVTPAPAAVTPAPAAQTQASASATAIASTGTATATATSIVTKFAPSSGRVSKGAVIDGKVPQNSPLFKMGLRSGDIITSVDGNPVNSMVDIRRVKADSKITFVRGDKIKVSGKPILQGNGGAAQASDGSKSNDITVDSIKGLQQSEMSLYEYYDSLEKVAQAAPAAPAQDAPAQEYGADEY